MRWFAVVACVLLGCDRPDPPPDPPSGGGAGGGSAPASAGEGGQEGAAADEGTPAADEGGTPPAATDRVPMIDADHPLYARLEGSGFPNDCKADSDCHKGGCSSEVCSADKSVVTTCEVVQLDFPADATCGCVAAQCQWFSPSGKPAGEQSASADVPKGNDGKAPSGSMADCGGKTCKPGQECIEYFGIAGAKGPKFFSCEIRCKSGSGCPKGTQCVTIADGPGSVCR